MGARAIAEGDKITGICPSHMVPGSSGTQPAGPQEFEAPISEGVVKSVLIAGNPAAVVTAFGYNKKAHKSIVDPPFANPRMQIGRITSGSTSVLIDSKPAATLISTAMCCATPAVKVGPGVPTVLIG